MLKKISSALVVFALGFSVSIGAGQAQQSPAVPNAILDQLQQRMQSQGEVQEVPSALEPQLQPQPQPQTQMLGPDADWFTKQSQEMAAPTRLEVDYAKRAGEENLRQFGYDQLLRPFISQGSVGAGAEDYWLGVGDEIVATLRGQRNVTYRSRIDREGRLVLPDLPPIPAAGRRFDDFRADLEAQVAANFIQTNVFVSLGAVRQISVVVAGEVVAPGPQTVSGLSTVLDALLTAGGVKKTGSLRRVQLLRDQQVITIDLYALLLGRPGADATVLRAGDRITVPSLGQTIAVTGDVLRPGIYELSGNTIEHQAALALAGGPLRAGGQYRHLRLSSAQGGGDQVQELAAGQGRLSGGDILMLQGATTEKAGFFSVEGNVSRPGMRDLGRIVSLRSLLAEHDLLLPDTYLPFAVVETSDPLTLMRRYQPVDLTAVRAGYEDLPLSSRDKVIILSREDVRYLASADVQAVLAGQQPLFGRGAVQLDNPDAAGEQLLDGRPTSLPISEDPVVQALESCKGLRELSNVVAASGVVRYANAREVLAPGQRPSIADVQYCPEVFENHPMLLPLLLDHVVSVQGMIARAGAYPVLPGVALDTVVTVAGGVTREADLNNVEVIRFGPDDGGDGVDSLREVYALGPMAQQVRLMPGDVVRVNPRFTDRDNGPVVLRGEVRRPGVYTIRRGERLSDVIARAGGLTEQAYPIGAVFTREYVRQKEQESYQTAARELEASMIDALSLGQMTPERQAALASMQGAVRTLREAQALGRVVVEADPAVLQVRPELDTVVEPGDTLFIPKRPNHVAVAGEVLHPGAQQFRSGQTADVYIRNAGGLRRAADEGRIFVLLPSGEARPLSLSFWNYSSVQIPPGSTIIVPRDPAPFSFWTFTRDITQVLSQVAISAASLAVISR